MMVGLAILCCVALTAGFTGLGVRIVRSLVCVGVVSWKAWTTVLALAAGLWVIGSVTLHPHQHVFQGLDASAYRLMGKAFAEGRPMRGPDPVLQEVPRDLRRWFMLMVETQERNTRDRSFEVTSQDTCETQPFFYPLLPLCMVGFDAAVPGDAADYLVPVLALLFSGLCLAVGLSRAGPTGALLALTLLFASPLPAWLFRGCYVETVGGMLIGLSVLAWILDEARERDPGFIQFVALGVAVSFHPVMLILSLPLLGTMLLLSRGGILQLVSAALAFALGLVPFVLLTLFVATPYGALSLSNLVFAVKVSASIRSTVVAVCGFVVVLLAALFMRERLVAALRARGRGAVVLVACLLLLWIVPTVLTVKAWSQGATVMAGVKELYAGLQWPFTAILAVLLAHALAPGESLRARLALTVVFVSLPVFLYLKGAEAMGLWSQRRLIAPLLVAIVCLLPSASRWVTRRGAPGRLHWARVTLVVGVLCAVGLANALKTPRLYRLRYEKGADAWVRMMRQRIGARFAVCDHFGYSVPLAVDGKTRVIGLSEEKRSFNGLGPVAEWLAEKAKKEPVLWITAWQNPGLEDGVILEREGAPEVRHLRRMRAKTSLPAVEEDILIRAELLKLTPIGEGDRPAVHKVFDGGVLALRPPWGRADIPIKCPSGNLPAQWSRQNSGIIGPVPGPGGVAAIRVAAVSGRREGVEPQALQIVPPWGGDPLRLVIGNGFTEAEGAMIRPAGDTNRLGRTGVYRLRSERPYDPAQDGIRKFDKDLGALIHSMRIELVDGPPMDEPAPKGP